MASEQITKRKNRLTIISESFPKFNNGRNRSYVTAQCECGSVKDYLLTELRGGRILSCGCTRKANLIKSATTHGLRWHSLYTVWYNMKRRCYDPSVPQFKDWGGRGIKVCDDWLNNFKAFYDWALLNGWRKRLVLDRENNDGNYEPSNCRFVTYKVSNRNQRRITLNEASVAQLRSLHQSGYSKQMLANLFNISTASVRHIVNLKQWV